MQTQLSPVHETIYPASLVLHFCSQLTQSRLTKLNLLRETGLCACVRSSCRLEHRGLFVHQQHVGTINHCQQPRKESLSLLFLSPLISEGVQVKPYIYIYLILKVEDVCTFKCSVNHFKEIEGTLGEKGLSKAYVVNVYE